MLLVGFLISLYAELKSFGTIKFILISMVYKYLTRNDEPSHGTGTTSYVKEDHFDFTPIYILIV